MDKEEAEKRIAFWKAKREAYKRKDNTNGVARADAAISRIEAARDISPKRENKRSTSIVHSEHKTKEKEV